MKKVFIFLLSLVVVIAGVFVWKSTTTDKEFVMTTQSFTDTDSGIQEGGRASDGDDYEKCMTQCMENVMNGNGDMKDMSAKYVWTKCKLHCTSK